MLHLLHLCGAVTGVCCSLQRLSRPRPRVICCSPVICVLCVLVSRRYHIPGVVFWNLRHFFFSFSFFMLLLEERQEEQRQAQAIQQVIPHAPILPSPTLTPTDPVPRGLLTLCPWASSGAQGLYTAYIQPIYSLYTAYMQPLYRLYTGRRGQQ